MTAEQTTRTYATVANMKKAEEAGKRCFAFSTETMEQTSATSGDYWNMRDDECLLDAEGNMMVLAVKVTRYIDPFTGEDFIAS